jgi:hypothetical protein
MSDALEEIAVQTGLAVNAGARSNHGKLGWGLSPNIERASVARAHLRVEGKRRGSKYG